MREHLRGEPPLFPGAYGYDRDNAASLSDTVSGQYAMQRATLPLQYVSVLKQAPKDAVALLLLVSCIYSLELCVAGHASILRSASEQGRLALQHNPFRLSEISSARVCTDPAWRPSIELPDAVTDRHPNLAAFQLTATLPVSLELTFLGGLAATSERHTQRRLQMLFAGLSGLVSMSETLRPCDECFGINREIACQAYHYLQCWVASYLVQHVMVFKMRSIGMGSGGHIVAVVASLWKLPMQVRTGMGMLLRAMPGGRPLTAAVLRQTAETPAMRLAAVTGKPATATAAKHSQASLHCRRRKSSSHPLTKSLRWPCRSSV